MAKEFLLRTYLNFAFCEFFWTRNERWKIKWWIQDVAYVVRPANTENPLLAGVVLKQKGTLFMANVLLLLVVKTEVSCTAENV